MRDRVATATEAAADRSSDAATAQKSARVATKWDFQGLICIKLLRRQLQRRIWPPITTGVYSPLGPKRKETHGAKYG